jgi:hypothetical protein
MATQICTRNATKLQLRKIVGTKLESLPRNSGECFCASDGYEGGDFFELFFDPVRAEFARESRESTSAVWCLCEP